MKAPLGPVGILDAPVCQRAWAAGAFLGNSECVASGHPRPSREPIQGASWGRKPLRETASLGRGPLASEPQDFQIAFEEI